MNREAIMQALFSLVSQSAPFVTASRRVRLWTDVASVEKPAIFMHEPDDTYTGADRHLPPTIIMNVEFFVYIDAGKDQSIAPITVLNPLIDAIDAAIAPSGAPGFRQTLGGLVSHCWIDGKVFKDPGDIDGDGLAIIPVKILANV